MFVICIESSHARGLGHLYRSLTLASAMRNQGMELHFLINDDPASVSLIKERGYLVDVVDLLSDGQWEQDWLHQHPCAKVWVNDRLDTSEHHARQIKKTGLALVTFDDRGGGAALADLHVASLVFENLSQLNGSKILHGIKYLLLNSELEKFKRLRNAMNSILVTLGGSDTWGVTPKVMQALLDRRLTATVVLGPAFQHHGAVDAVLSRAPVGLFTVHRDGVPSLAVEMTRHDLAITGGGMTPFEANAIGLPCMVIANEKFEEPVGRALESMGGCVFAGFHERIEFSRLDDVLPVTKMSQAGMDAIDFAGCNRIVHELGMLRKGLH